MYSGTLSTGIIIYSVNRYLSLCTLSTGDPRRPYPTDLDMRQGFLGGMGTYPDHSRHPPQTQTSTGEELCSHSYDGDYCCKNYSLYFHTVELYVPQVFWFSD